MNQNSKNFQNNQNFRKLLFNHVLSADPAGIDFDRLNRGEALPLYSEVSEHFVKTYDNTLKMVTVMPAKEQDWHIVTIQSYAPYMKKMGTTPQQKLENIEKGLQGSNLIAGYDYELMAVYPKGLIGYAEDIPKREPTSYVLALNKEAFAKLTKVMLLRMAAPNVGAKMLPKRFSDNAEYKDIFSHPNSTAFKSVVRMVQNADLKESDLQKIVGYARGLNNEAYAELLIAAANKRVSGVYRPYHRDPHTPSGL